MKCFLRKTLVFTALALSLLIFSTSIASANMTHKQVKGTIYKAGCPMMKMMSTKTAGCPMMKMMMNSKKRNMKMDKKM